jgi:hypothetical protein
MALNSSTLAVTIVALTAEAWAAIKRSCAPPVIGHVVCRARPSLPSRLYAIQVLLSSGCLVRQRCVRSDITTWRVADENEVDED